MLTYQRQKHPVLLIFHINVSMNYFFYTEMHLQSEVDMVTCVQKMCGQVS